MIHIVGLSWDEAAEEHIAQHGVTIDEVEETIEHAHYARRSGKYVLFIGQTEGMSHINQKLSAGNQPANADTKNLCHV